jgi:hypothetical protein
MGARVSAPQDLLMAVGGCQLPVVRLVSRPEQRLARIPPEGSLEDLSADYKNNPHA